jgi:hypothetical protein
MHIAITDAGHSAARSTNAHAIAATARRAAVFAAMAGTLAVAMRPGIATAQQSRPTASVRPHAMPTIPQPERRCLDTAATIVPARLDDEHLIYVEQETVVANRDGRILVAGAPVFVWRHAGDHYDLLGLDSLFGMVVEPTSKFVRPVPSPLPGRAVDGIRAVALTDGWWLVAFAEVLPNKTSIRPRVVGMWTGETDGTNWRAVEKLPPVSDTLDVMRLSELALGDGRVRLAAPVRRGWRRRVVLFSRDDGRWTVRDYDLGLTDDVAIAATESSDVLAVVRPDTTVGGEDHNSLFVYSKSPSDTNWAPHPRLWRGGSNPVHKPLFAGDSRHPLLLWRTGPMFRATSAWVLSLTAISDRGAAPVPLQTYVGNMTASSLGDAGVIAIHDDVAPTRDLRLFEYHAPLRVNAVLSKATEYRGLLGMALTASRVVLIASKAAQPPRDPAVISMIETHAWRCPISDTRSP